MIVKQLYLTHVDASTAVITTTSTDIPPLLLRRPLLLLTATHLLAIDQSGLGMAACLPLCGLEVSVERGEEGGGEELERGGGKGEVEEGGSAEEGEGEWSLTCFCGRGGRLCGSVSDWWHTLPHHPTQRKSTGALDDSSGERRGRDEGSRMAEGVTGGRGGGGEADAVRTVEVQGGGEHADLTIGLQVYCQVGEAAHIQLVPLLLRQVARSAAL
ncbi:unnamed protein product [Closterium sp. Naga37s-1]|nr:unnamed protein product [Closterium sp. Naga37s-1]